MSIFNNIATLLDVSQATNQSQSGNTYLLLPVSGDGVPTTAQSLRVFFDATLAGGATSPTVDVRLQTSHDKVSWINAVSMTQLTAAIPRHEFVAVAALGPYVRAISELGGGTLPNHTVKVVLASNGGFTLRKV